MANIPQPYRPAVIFLSFVIAVLSFSPPALAQGRAGQSLTWTREPALSKHDLGRIQRVLVVTYSDANVASQFCEDVLAVELMAARISVVSREKRDREQLLRLVEIEESGDTGQGKATKPKDKLADLFAVGESTQADALIVVTLVADTVQQNVFDGAPNRVSEVRNSLSVHLASVTVVEVGTGRLFLAGFVGYATGASLLRAAQDIGQGLVQQLR
jgi:hypothetical protein